jgi:hypothetical protein
MLVYSSEIYNDLPSIQDFTHILRVLEFHNTAVGITATVPTAMQNT